MKQVIFTEKDYIIVIGVLTKNDVKQKVTVTLLSFILDLVNPTMQETSLIMPSIPLQFNNPVLNKDIVKINKLNNFEILSLSKKARTCY